MILTIELGSIDNASAALSEVATLIEAGYTSGLIGWSCDSWTIEE